MHVMQQCIVHCGRVVFFRVFAKKKIKKTRTFMVVGQTFVAGISCATARFAAKSGHREISVSELPLHSAGRGRKGSSVGPLLQPQPAIEEHYEHKDTTILQEPRL